MMIIIIIGVDSVRFKPRMNQHISESRTGVSICEFPIHAYKCGLKNNCLNELFFQINDMMKLQSSNQLETYENYFQRKGYDTVKEIVT